MIIPGENDMYSALTLTTIDKAVVENKGVQKLLGIINLKLDEILKET